MPDPQAELLASRDRWKTRAHYLLGAVRHYRLALDAMAAQRDQYHGYYADSQKRVEALERIHVELAKTAQLEQARLMAELEAAVFRWQDWQKLANERSAEIVRLADRVDRVRYALNTCEIHADLEGIEERTACAVCFTEALTRLERTAVAADAAQRALLNTDIHSASMWKRIVVSTLATIKTALAGDR